MFINEYYFGQNGGIMFMRIFLGPALIYLGFGLYGDALDRFGIAIGALCYMYGIYYTFQPVTWVLSRWSSYKDAIFEIEVTPDKIILKEEMHVSETNFGAFKKILKRKTYYALVLGNHQKIYIPFDSLEVGERKILDEKTTNLC